MCEHHDGRLVVDLSYHVPSRALTWVLTATDADGQVQWLRDGSARLDVAGPGLWAALGDCLADQLTVTTGVPATPFD